MRGENTDDLHHEFGRDALDCVADEPYVSIHAPLSDITQTTKEGSI